MKADAKNIVHFIKLIDNKQVKSKYAAKILGYSESHFCAVRKKYRRMGEKAFVHGLAGKRGNRATKAETVRKIQRIYCRDYQDESFTLFHEEFTSDYNVGISLSTVSRILKRCGFVSPQSKKRGSAASTDAGQGGSTRASWCRWTPRRTNGSSARATWNTTRYTER